jgi:hypothetical protein
VHCYIAKKVWEKIAISFYKAVHEEFTLLELKKLTENHSLEGRSLKHCWCSCYVTQV